MAKLTARIDFYNNLWESKQMVDVFQNGTDEQKRDWMLANCKLEEPEDCDLDEIFDEEIAKGSNYAIFYDDWGMCESVYLIEW